MTDTFQFNDMCPELRAYLDHQADRSTIDQTYAKVTAARTAEDQEAEKAASEVHQAALQAHREEGMRLKDLIPKGLLARYFGDQQAWMCRDATQTGDAAEHLSPSGRWRLVITRHHTGKGTWPYSKGRVYEVETGRLIETVNRNYGAFPFAWVESHATTGQDFLVCGEDYQGQTVIELNTGRRVDHLPISGGFCWAAIKPNTSGTLLAVHGCYWACPYETIIVDFAQPMDPPWLILARDEDDAFDGWVSDTSCRIGARAQVVNIPGHPLHGKKEDDLTWEELEEVERYATDHELPKGPDGEDAGWQEVLDTHLWTLGSDLDLLRAWLKDCVLWRRTRGYELPPDLARQLSMMVSRVQPTLTFLGKVFADEPEMRQLLKWGAAEGYKALIPVYERLGDDDPLKDRMADELDVLWHLCPDRPAKAV